MPTFTFGVFIVTFYLISIFFIFSVNTYIVPLKKVIAESVKRVVRGLNEKKEDHSYKPISSQTFYTNNGKTEHKSIVTLQAPSGQVCHIAEDDHCYVLYNGSGIHYDGDGLKDKNCEMIHYIFPEAFKALKELPLMKCIIEQMGNPSRTSEEIKNECMLFLTHTDFTVADCEIIKDYEITIDVTTRAFLTEMSSEKTHYAFFLLNKNDGPYVIYDFLVSVIDSRIVDQEYIAKHICQPLFSRLKMNNGNKDIYIRILGYSQDEYCKIIREDNIKEISVEIAKLICKK